jgi:hypothetical protein
MSRPTTVSPQRFYPSHETFTVHDFLRVHVLPDLFAQPLDIEGARASFRRAMQAQVFGEIRKQAKLLRVRLSDSALRKTFSYKVASMSPTSPVTVNKNKRMPTSVLFSIS